MKKYTAFILSLLVMSSSIAPLVRAQVFVSPLVGITGFQVSGSKEYVELYNYSEIETDVDGWKLEYRNASGSNIKTIALLEGDMLPRAHVMFASEEFAVDQQLELDSVPYVETLYTGMADSGGSIRLYRKVEATPDYPDRFELVDMVGWKNTSAAAEDVAVVSLIGTLTMKRCTDGEGIYVHRQNNQIDFYIPEMPLLLQTGELCKDLVVDTPVEEPPIEEPPVEGPIVETLSCEGVIVNEIFPNAAGDDTGKEYIELWNSSNESIDLMGCTVEVGTKSYVFNETLPIEPGGFVLLSDTDIAITLPNSSGGVVRLVSAADVEISVVTYPEDMDDDQSWSRINNEFVLTYIPTPGVQNVFLALKPCAESEERDATTNYCRKIVLASVVPEVVCQPDQFLNTATNRCNKREDTAIKDCGPGQIRNPETNRCRSVVGTTLASTLTPCLEGQERNPDTNRCRAIATNQLVACKEGQERNPETNRCRTIVLAATTTNESIQDIETIQSEGSDWIMGLVVFLGAISYVVYEWRAEIGTFIYGLRSRVRRTL